MKKYFTEQDIQVTKVYQKKCSTSLANKEMQIKTIMRGEGTPWWFSG